MKKIPNSNRKITFLSLLGIFAIYSSIIFLKDITSPRLMVWGKKFIAGRVPAESIIGDRDIGVLKDYFDLRINDKKFKYDIEFQVRTNADEDYMKEKARKAIYEAFQNTFIQMYDNNEINVDIPLQDIAKEKLTSSFIKHFVKTIKIYKLFNTGIQVDLKFVPKTDSSTDLSHELSSNHLVKLSDKNKLFKKLTDEKKSLISTIANMNLPASKERFQFNGGAITIWVKVLDMSFEFGSPIPNPKKNAVNGFVRYRRYFKDLQLGESKINFKNNEFNVNSIIFERKNKFDKFITVDIYKYFNLQNIIPTLDKAEIFFGKLIEPNMHRDGIFGDFFYSKVSPIQTGKLYIQGTTKHGYRDHKFKILVKKLVYDFNNKKINKSKSRFLTRLLGAGLYNGDDFNEQDIKWDLKSFILKKHNNDLIKALGLGRFHKDMGGTK